MKKRGTLVTLHYCPPPSVQILRELGAGLAMQVVGFFGAVPIVGATNDDGDGDAGIVRVVFGVVVSGVKNLMRRKNGPGKKLLKDQRPVSIRTELKKGPNVKQRTLNKVVKRSPLL